MISLGTILALALIGATRDCVIHGWDCAHRAYPTRHDHREAWKWATGAVLFGTLSAAVIVALVVAQWPGVRRG